MSFDIVDTETAVNKRLLESWSWIPAAVRRRFTPTSVVSIIVVTFGCGGAVATYRAKFHESEMARRADHSLLVEQAKGQSAIAVQLAKLDGTLNGLNDRLGDLENWRNGVTHVAETTPIPKARRAHRP